MTNNTANLTSPLSPGAATGGACLILYYRHGARSVALRPGEPLVVGRTAPADVVVDDGSLSREHARVMLVDGELEVEDLESTNGTWLGGEHVTQARVKAGVEVSFGGVAAILHVRTADATLGLALDGHDRFSASCAREVERASFYRRPLALLMVRSALSGNAAHVSQWAPALLARLRPVDRAAIYSQDVIEVLVPELDVDAAAALAAAIVAPRGNEPPLVCGVSVVPACASNADRLLETAREALQRATAAEPVVVADAKAERALPSGPDDGLVCESAAMRKTIETARLLARGVIPVLLQGETGSGKEVVARFIHRSGPRRERPLIAVNCAVLPLVESTLFGHEKGAFTGAHERHVGVFEAADSGTVFLDEIGELSAEAQAKLLRVLESKSVLRVGSTREIEVDVRIIAASHRNLEAMVAEGRFREDLLYRLNAMTLLIPPLRERREDIAPLVRRSLELANAANHTDVREIDPAAMAVLERYDWPGNVRELGNAIHRAVVVAQHGAVMVDDLPARPREMSSPRPLPARELAGPSGAAGCHAGEDFRSCMERLEMEVLRSALIESEWNQTLTAARLTLPLRTLVRKIALYGLQKPQ